MKAIKSIALLALVVSGCSEQRNVVRDINRGMDFAFHVAPDSTKDELTKLARDTCGAVQQCSVMGWLDADAVARGMPMTDREAGSMSFHYRINRHTGYEQSTFDCTVWPSPDTECIAK